MDSDADIQGEPAANNAEATGGDAAGSEAQSDEAILAEIQASGEGADPGDEQPAGEAEGDTTKPDAPKPEGDKPAEDDEKKASDPVKDAERRARRILATANRQLAAARHKSREGVEQIVAGLKSKPLETLRMLGVPIGEILASGENEGEAAKPKTAEERLDQLEKEIQQSRAQAAEAAENARIDAQIAAKKAEITADLKAAAKDFPLINRGEAHDLVFETMLEYHRIHGTRTTPAAAAKVVEDYLQKLSGGAAPSVTATSDGKPKPAPQRQGATTLGNQTRNVAPTEDDWPDDIDARVALAAKELGLTHN